LGHYLSRLVPAAILRGYLLVLPWCSGIMADRRATCRTTPHRGQDFDAEEYWKFNFTSLLPEDAQIIQRASNFLIDACGDRASARSAVDVGVGSNLYPALLLLPWTDRITFAEYAGTNINWLTENLADAPGEWAWQPFWDLVAGCQGRVPGCRAVPASAGRRSRDPAPSASLRAPGT
jgi:hypothetical protein